MNTPAPPSSGDETAFGAALGRFVSSISLMAPDVIVSSGWLEHGAFAFWLIETLKPVTYVELGTHSGYSYFAVCQAIRKLDLSTKCYAVDTWRGDEHAGFYDDSVYRAVTDHNEKYKAFSTLVQAKFDDAVRYFADASIDLLHIDGRHFYDDVKADFETWRPKLTENAVVLFHDTNVRERDFGVWRFFLELKANYATFEFMHGHGLGVLAIGIIPNALQGLFTCKGGEADAVRAIYAQLGANLSQRWAAKEARRFASELEQLTGVYNVICAKERELQHHFALLQREHSVLRRNHDELVEALDATEGALLVIANSDRLRMLRTLPRLPLVERIAKLTERFFPAVKMDIQAQNNAIIANIRGTGLFQDRYYLATNPQVLVDGIDPALHFALFGWKDGRKPNPFFDPLYYIKNYFDSSLKDGNPLLYYSLHGWKEGHRPSAEFDPDFYLERYPDVERSGQEPLRHYIENGRKEGRLANHCETKPSKPVEDQCV